MDPRLEPLRAAADPFERRLGFMAIVSEEFRRRGARPPVIVGGHALEIYTRGHFATRDIDVVVADRRLLEEVCTGLGMTRHGRHFAERELGIALEAPGTELPEREIEVLVDGRPVRVIAVEELVVDRLNAYVHWKSARDGDWAEMLLALHGDRLDWEFLERRAREEELAGALAEVRMRAGEGCEPPPEVGG